MHFTPSELAAEAFLLLRVAGARIFSRAIQTGDESLVLLPARLGLPGPWRQFRIHLVAHSSENFRWSFVGIYAVLPVILVILIWDASRRDPEQRGDWRDFLVLLILGVVVEFKLFERALAAWHVGSCSIA